MKQQLQIVILLFPLMLNAQLSKEEYIQKNASKYTLEDFTVDFGPELDTNNVVFWGYFHGSEIPHIVEHKLLERFSKIGFRYYMPEIGKAQAFFLNRYLQTGDERLLYFASYYQGMRTPQDASVQFLEKWRRIYRSNLSLPINERIIVLGVEGTIAPYDPSLAITYLAFNAPQDSGIPMIDSLRFFRNLDILDINVVSGKPALELAIANDKPTYDYVYPLDSKYQFARRFIAYYQEHRGQVEKAFGKVKIHNVLALEDMKREQIIYKNFKRDVLPLLRQGEKVFSVFGYTHVLQGPINEYDYIARLIKSHQEVSVASILGVMAKSNVLKQRKLCKTTTILGPQGIEFMGAKYCGYSTSKSYDGDSLFEKVSGVSLLKKETGKHDVLTLPIGKEGSPFNKGLDFIAYRRGGKHWRPEHSMSTLDYIQYLIYIQNSNANTPLEEWVVE